MKDCTKSSGYRLGSFKAIAVDVELKGKTMSSSLISKYIDFIYSIETKLLQSPVTTNDGSPILVSTIRSQSTQTKRNGFGEVACKVSRLPASSQLPPGSVVRLLPWGNYSS